MELFNMLNPINHADTPEKVESYKVEPYVIAADIYSVPPTGRGGWTWYAGSSGWMYHLGLEAILGVTKLGSAFSINLCIPGYWAGFKVDYRFGATYCVFEIYRGIEFYPSAIISHNIFIPSLKH